MLLCHHPGEREAQAEKGTRPGLLREQQEEVSDKSGGDASVTQAHLGCPNLMLLGCPSPNTSPASAGGKGGRPGGRGTGPTEGSWVLQGMFSTQEASLPGSGPGPLEGP